MWNDLANLIRCRSLIWTLVGRELKARYRGSFLGFLWSFLNPLLLMLVYALVFSYYLRQGVEHYAIFLFCGLLPWLWFSSSLIEGASSIITGGALIKKVLFPAEILPIVSVLSNLVHFILGLPMLAAFLFFSKMPIKLIISFMPVLIFIQLFLTLGLALVLAAFTVHFRDLQHILGNLLTLWFFVSPIIYPASSIPERFRLTLLINPMAPLIMGYQDLLYYGNLKKATLISLGPVAILALLCFIIGYWVFNHFKETFSEEV